MTEETKTIIESVAESGDVDVSSEFQTFWKVLSGYRDRITALMPVEPHPSSPGDWSSPDGSFEGSLNTYTGPQLDWFVHSWAGNRRASILDMNITAWLAPHIDVPHLVLIFGTVPNLYHYSDFLSRRDLMTDVDYLNRYYEPENRHALEWRADPRWTWSVSHGTYMRTLLSPAAFSFMAERNEDNMATMLARADARFERWLQLVAEADPVPDGERAALQARDRRVRENAYTLDPMNALAAQKMGRELTDKMVKLRYGHDQLYTEVG